MKTVLATILAMCCTNCCAQYVQWGDRALSMQILERPTFAEPMPGWFNQVGYMTVHFIEPNLTVTLSNQDLGERWTYEDEEVSVDLRWVGLFPEIAIEVQGEEGTYYTFDDQTLYSSFTAGWNLFRRDASLSLTHTDYHYSFSEDATGRPYDGGDTDADGMVDARDAGRLFAQWGPVPQFPTEFYDANGDYIVDALEAGILFEKWTGDASVIPEPSLPAFALFGLPYMLWWYHRRNNERRWQVPGQHAT